MGRKKRSKVKKLPAAQHALPEGFWQQATAVVLAVFGLLLVLAMFGTGGPVLEWLHSALKWLVGWTVVALPVIAVYLAVAIFRAENNRLPVVVILATILFMIEISAFVHLFSVNPLDFDNARSADGGGLVGYGVDSFLLKMLDERTTGLILAVLAFITSLFVLKLSPLAVLQWIIGIFKREVTVDEHNREVAEKVAQLDHKSIGELKLNEGVPTMHSGGKGFRNAFEKPQPEQQQSALTSATDPDWKAPSLDLLEKKQSPADAGDVKHNAQIIRDTLSEFNIDVDMEGANIGPKVTQYTLKPPAGVKLTRITALETNIALNLAAQAIRIEAPIPGQRAVGIEVPNRKAADVRLHGILESPQWQSASSNLNFAIGRDIAGEAVILELSKMPHVLIAGATGSGKSVMINTLLTSLLYRNSPSDLKLILVDPKQVELTPYNDIPHLLTPVITEPEKCISALKWAVNEMERRYSLLAEEKVRDIAGYNEHKKPAGEGMPYIVIVIDELADLMMLAARDVEALIVRLAQKARAVGVHLVLATQRPSVDVITGLIKANVPARIAFTVASQVDSRTIIDQIGAEKLLGQGDMLLLTPQMTKPKRVQGAWVTDEEVVRVTDHLRMQRPPQYDEEIIAQPVQLSGKGGVVMDYDGGGDDDMYKDAVRCVIESGKASSSLLQRRLRVGYARAARLIETMEEQGIVGPADGARPRDVLVSSLDDVMGGPGDPA
jgi:DNA segregation ATPase FtsK/SpoIIIE, S-DNA-T family